MNCIFKRRGFPTPTTAFVIINGSGDNYNGYVRYDGTKYYTDGDAFRAEYGGDLTFHLASYTYTSSLTVNGVVITSISSGYENQVWTIPQGTQKIDITVEYDAYALSYGVTFTVVTS